ncbi:MAG TPA: leucyl/phenylalanyl-tRNA--protein transferase [Puia sp.]|nr:leucyl/phenylalanyl-tRNA--protein transferase [Puia sp.]
MPVFVLDEELSFPPVHLAEPNGLLAIGGDLSPERLILAYKNGIFPWYDEGDILWWSPDPRFILRPGELKVSKTMQQLLKKKAFEFTVNKAFNEVISNCRSIVRPGQTSTWITRDVEEAYTILHENGLAVSAEVWLNEKLSGGLYGIRMGRAFFGESMFSNLPNASKFALINFIRLLQNEGLMLIDCQVYTKHLESLGAKMVSRSEFILLLNECF